MAGCARWLDVLFVLMATYLIIDTVKSWNAYKLCYCPIQIFYLLTYSLFIFYKLFSFGKTYLNSSNFTHKVLSYLLNVLFNLGFVYITIQGIIWQVINEKKTPECSISRRELLVTWFLITILIIYDIMSIASGIFRTIRWWRIRSYRRRIQTLVDEIMLLHGQQAQRLEDFLNMMPSLNDMPTNMNDQLGLTREDLSKIPKKPFSKSYRKYLSLNQQALCPICFEDYKVSEEVSVLPTCDHTFHPKCIEKWLSQNPLCPMCRTNVRNSLLIPLLDSIF